MKISPMIIAALSIILIAFSGCQSVPSVNTATPDEQKSISVSAGKAETASVAKSTTLTEETQTASGIEKATEPITISQSEEQAETKAVQPESAEEQSTHQNKTESVTNNPDKKSTQKMDSKPAEKKTEAAKPELETQAPSADKTAALQSGIAYGQTLGMELNTSLNIGNSSWFSPTDISYFPTTAELTGLCCEKIDYLLSYWGEQGYKAEDFYFNLIISDGDLYLLYA